MKETIKTIVLTALLSGIVSFLVGIHYGQGQISLQAAQSLLKASTTQTQSK